MLADIYYLCCFVQYVFVVFCYCACFVFEVLGYLSQAQAPRILMGWSLHFPGQASINFSVVDDVFSLLDLW